ncbi:MAG: cell division protein FtsA [Anaerolineae bacterium]|nr:cell division protein FtsA [Anaerolineae bacterium]
MSSEQRIAVGIDIGTTKVCTLVGELSDKDRIRIIGLGLEPAQGMHKGTVVDVAQATEAIRAAKRQAERTSGYEIGRAYISVAGKHISSLNSKGVTGLNPSRGVVTPEEIERALEAARAVALPHNREVLHVIPRTFTLDGQEGIRNPLGLHAYRLEVEAHIITAASSSLRNLETCVNDSGLAVDRFVLNQLASGEVALTEAERESGVAVIDIGGGTTDLAIFIEGTVWHTAVIEVGGNHITSDIAHVLHLPLAESERIKVDYGNANPDNVNRDMLITVQPFGEEMPTQLLAHDVARIIEARVDEIFTLVMQEIKRSGYDGLLPAGIVLTGGTALLKGIRQSASKIMRLPARTAQPEDITGLVDKLQSPAYSTGVGLLRFAQRIDTAPIVDTTPRRPRGGRRGGSGEGPDIGKTIGDFLGRLLPD